MTHAVHPLQACWDAALAPVRAQALELALTLDVFSLLRAPSTPAALAARLSLAPANTAHWLELLWSMGLLTRQPAGDVWAYGVADALAPYLLAGAADDCRHALRHRLHTLAEFAGQLPAWLTRDAIEPAASASAWAQAGQSHLAQEQRAVTAKVALDCVAGLPGLDGERWFLDLGGGPGQVAIALAHAHPQWRGRVFDLPDAVAVAADSIAAAGLAPRLQACGGDLARDPLGEGYHLIWCSSVLHFAPDLHTALARIAAALAPGGYLISLHAERPQQAADAAAVLPYYLPLLLRGRHVWREGELALALPAHGLHLAAPIQSHSLPLAPAPAIIARKPMP